MNKMTRRCFCPAVSALCGAALALLAPDCAADPVAVPGSAFVGRSVNVNVRHYPVDTPSVSSKSERATTRCQRCGTSLRYERTYAWDARGHGWVETTKDVPELCRKCQQGEKAQEKLDREERKLDAQIRYLETKDRIRAKKARAARLRQGGD